MHRSCLLMFLCLCFCVRYMEIKAKSAWLTDVARPRARIPPRPRGALFLIQKQAIDRNGARQNRHAATYGATAQIAVLRFCKTPFFVGDLAEGRLRSVVRCPGLLSQICSPQNCKTHWFRTFRPMCVCNFSLNHCNIHVF